MNIIIGTGKYKSYYLTIFILLTFIFGCNKNKEAEQNTVTPKADVEVTTIEKANLSDTIYMVASSFYNNKSIVLSPISGYLTSVKISNGENIHAGELLFEVITKEYNALKDFADSLYGKKKGGKIEINSPISGQVSDLNVSGGQYIPEGTSLCSITDLSGILFKLYVPLQYKSDIFVGKICTLQMPDGRNLNGKVINLSVKTEQNTQTEVYLLKPLSDINLPEGVNLKAYIVKQKSFGAQVLPKSAVLSSEKLDEYWVVRVINDSTAIKVPVEIGNIYNDIIEIKEPIFSPDDKIVTSGNYGLPDTAFVHIITKTDEK